MELPVGPIHIGKDFTENSAGKYLAYYGEHFSTVEINNTFYRLPSSNAVENWERQVPNEFIFSVKASGYITHRKRLNVEEDSLSLFCERVKLLKEKLGPILFQLPPSFKSNPERLEIFLRSLDPNLKHVFEFRHDSWFNDDVYDLLKKHQIGLCITDLGGHLSPEVVTGGLVYIRLHGPRQAYSGTYGKQKLKEWNHKIQKWATNSLEVFCYFDNDEKGYALQDAMALKEMLKETV